MRVAWGPAQVLEVLALPSLRMMSFPTIHFSVRSSTTDRHWSVLSSQPINK